MSGFGSNSGFGGPPTSSAPSFGTANSGFGGPPTSTAPSFGTASLFGTGGQNITSASLFGANMSTPTFSSTPFGTQPTASQASVFGTSGTSPPPAFGQQGGAPGQASPAFSQPGSSLFGQNQHQTFGQTNASAVPAFGGSTSSLFGKPTSKVQSAPQVSIPAFGQPPSYSTSVSNMSSDSKGTFSAFGKPAGLNPTSTATSSNLFGGPAPAGSLFGKTTAQPPNFFGKRESDANPGFSQSTTSGNMIHVKPESQFGLIGQTQPNVIKTESGVSIKSEHPTGLFGKGRVDIKPERQFGADEKTNVPDNTALFGKPKETQNLFGRKSPEKDETSKTSSSVRQLFGKPVQDETSATTGSTRGRGWANNERRLFTRGQPIKRLGRISESELATERRNSQESEKGQRTPLQRQVSDDPARKVSIVCKQVPAKFNNQSELKRHFRRFGYVTKVFPNVNKMQATIHFKTHEEASEAKRRGRVIARGIPPMSIFWSSYMLPSSPTEASSSAVGDRPFTRQAQGPSRAPFGRVRGAPWKHPDDVNEELDSMAGTRDFTGQRPPTQRPATSSQERPQRGTSPVPSSSGEIKSEKVSLNQFHLMTATSTTDKAQLLKMRDKYIRQNTKKTIDVDAKAFVGTCPDMCPERERYDREDKRQLNYYEIVPGTDGIHGKNPEVDHRRAVKEYLRSSPDQEQPLPHELRPLPVLQQTMTYLLKEVANQGEEGRWGDWFDFLWNRTRGIRKDITQQQLCDRHAAELIEKCARFHIYCSERLCEEDMHSFDAKINDENLTKCLQTLKEFYMDLEKKQKVFCQNEAEFRAYTVLMNLNEGDTLREVQKLRAEVRSSIPMRFALEVYFSLSSNNYIKFFRLLRNASFANACIMHRYFPQVRIKALLSMMKGYRLGSKPAQIPLTELERLLAFESTSEVVRFCSHYGFDTREGDVILDRNSYMEPDSAWIPVRSKNYIESKLLVSCGEMIYGESFPPDYTLHIPTSSFDEYGRLLFDGKGVSVNNEKAVPQIESKPVIEDHRAGPSMAIVEPVQGPPPVNVDVKPPAPFVAPQELVRDAAKVLFWEVIGEMLTTLCEDKKAEVDSMLEESEKIADIMATTVVWEEVSTMVQEVHDEANAEKIRKEAEELAKLKEKLSDEILNGILYDVLYLETDTITKEEYREVEAQKKKERIERVSFEIHKNCYENVSSTMAKEISEEVFETDVVQRLKEIEEAENAVKTMRTRRCWVEWQKKYLYRKKLKRSVREFPPSASLEPLEIQNEKLSGHLNTKVIDRQFLVGKSAKLTVQSQLEIMKQREANEYKCALNDLKRTMQTVSAWKPEDVTQVIYKTLQKKVKKAVADDKSMNVGMQWKILIGLPEIRMEKPRKVEDIATKLLSDWFTRKYTFGSPPEYLHHEKSNVLTLSKSSHKFDEKSNSHGRFHLDVCIRSVDGRLRPQDVASMVEDRIFLGTAGMIFVLSAPVVNLHEPKASYWAENRKRLRSVLEAGRSPQAISLVIVMALLPRDFGNHDSFSGVSEGLRLEDLIEGGQIFDYHFIDVKFDPDLYHGVHVTDPEFYKKVCESMDWIADRTLTPPSLKVSRLEDFIDSVLIKMFYPPMLQNLKARKENGYLERNPNSILELYNSVIDHTRYVVTSTNLSELSWPVPEFVMKQTCNLPAKHWNTPEYLDQIADILHSFRLPEFVISKPESDSWADAKRDVRAYFADHLGVKSPVIWANLNSLLKQVEVDFEEKCQLYKGEVGCQPFYVHLPFSKIIPLCIEHKMETTDFRDHTKARDKMGCVHELRVAYSLTELRDFVNPVDWQHQEAEESFKGSPSLELTLQAAANKQASERSKRKMKRTISVDIPDKFKESKKMADNLLHSVRQERTESENFIKKLEEELAKGEEELRSFDNLSKIEWKENQNSLRRKSDSGLRRRKSEEFEYDLVDKGKRPRKRYSEIGIATRTFPRLSLGEDVNSLQNNVRKFKEEYAVHQERMNLDIDYNETLLSKLVRDKLQNETF